MFTKKPTNVDSALDEVITAALADMRGFPTDSEQYAVMLNNLTQLYSLKEKNSRKPISRDTQLIVAGNLLGIIAILSFEKANVVTSKALSFVMKLK